MPKRSSFSDLFGRSPFKALQQHSEAVNKCAHVLPDLFDAISKADKGVAQSHIDTIFKLESEADEVKNGLRAHLPKSLFMPVDRRDLLEILDLQDAIADTAQDIAGLFEERTMEIPEGLSEALAKFVRRCVDASDQSDKIINELDELIATGFRGRESDTVSGMVDVLNDIESETDAMGTTLARQVFALEGKMSSVSIILWYEIVQKIGQVADYAEKVGNRLRLVIAR